MQQHLAITEGPGPMASKQTKNVLTTVVVATVTVLVLHKSGAIK